VGNTNRGGKVLRFVGADRNEGLNFFPSGEFSKCVRLGKKAGCAFEMRVEAFFCLDFLLLFCQEKSKSTGSLES
jgi:hypothetical protein